MNGAHALVRTLVDLGYVRQEPSRQYALGPRILLLAESASSMLASVGLALDWADTQVVNASQGGLFDDFGGDAHGSSPQEPPLAHAEWHGCTPTDLVFPFFLFAVGNALALTAPPRPPRETGARRTPPRRRPSWSTWPRRPIPRCGSSA